MAQNFGSATNLSQVAVSNPGIFARHVAANLMAAPGDLYRLLFVHADLVLPDRMRGLEAFGLLVLALGLLVWTRGQWLPHVAGRLRAQRWLWAALAAFALPALLSLALISPRAHYLEVVGMAVVVAAAVMTRGEGTDTPFIAARIAAIGLALVLITPSPWFLLGAPEYRFNLATIRYLQELAVTEPVNLLEAKGGFAIYLGDNYQRVREVDKAAPFDQFPRAQAINMIVVDETLRNDSRFRDDPQWQAFLADPVTAGYSVLAIPNTDRTLIIATSLLQNNQ